MKTAHLRALIMAALISALLSLCVGALAAPRNINAELYTQPSGDTFMATMEGGTAVQWLSTSNGYALLTDESGTWCYAIPDGDFARAGSAYANSDADGGDVPAAALLSSELYELMPVEQNAYETMEEYNSLSPRGSMLGKKNTLVLLISTRNAQIRQTDAFWSRHIFGIGGTAPNASVRDYYRVVSENKIDLVPMRESRGIANDGIVRMSVNADHPGRNYYECSNIASSALKAADSYIDFSAYDTNGDGYIYPDELHIIAILAGYEASRGLGHVPAIWAHYAEVKYPLPRVDGVYVGTGVSYIGEHMDERPITIGPIAHELGHSMSLADIYDTDSSSLGAGMHSLMSNGSWGYISNSGDCPAYMDAFSREYLGIITPQVVTNGSHRVSAASTGAADILRVNTPVRNEYFLIENRQLSGFDRGIRGWFNESATGGIAIWHIDSARYGSGGNNDENHKAIDLEEANEYQLGYSQLDTNTYYGYDHYYSSNINTEFSADTRPNSNTYASGKSGVSIRVPGASANTMIVIIGDDIATPTPTTTPTLKPTATPTPPVTPTPTLSPTATPVVPTRTAVPTTGFEDKYEPNDSFAQAVELGEVPIHPTIHRVGDEDFFTFALDTRTEVRLDMAPPSGQDYDMYLYSHSHAAVANSRNSGELAEQIVRQLNPGVYYVRVRGYNRAYNYAMRYTLKLTMGAASTQTPVPSVTPGSPDGDEYEPNNSFLRATDITALIHSTLYPTLHSSSDTDCYAIRLDSTANIHLALEPPEDCDYDVYIYTENKRIAASSRGSGDVREEIDVRLDAGLYYIRVRGYSGSNSLQPYYMLVSSDTIPTGRPSTTPTHAPTGRPSTTPTHTPTDRPSTTPTHAPTGRPSTTPTHTPTPKPSHGIGDIYEPNSSFRDAKAIGKSTLHPTIHETYNNDYFTFNLMIGLRVELNMLPPADKDYDLYLYNSSRRLVAGSRNAQSAAEKIVCECEPGTYYVRVIGHNGEYDAVNTYALSLAEYMIESTAEPTRLPTPTPTRTLTPVPTLVPTQVPTPTPALGAKYRALLVANWDYPGQQLNGPGNDANAMRNVLSSTNYDGASFSEIKNCQNATYAEISQAVSQLAAIAEPSDVTFFYYSGHSSVMNGSACLQLVDGSIISVKSLESMLSQVCGTVVVLLDSCRSGGFINRAAPAEGAEADCDGAAFTQSVIQTFSRAAQSGLAARSLTGSKYKVLAASSSSELSYEGTVTINGVKNVRGLFTAAFELGATTNSGGTMNADTDSDQAVSLYEMLNYTREMVNVFLGNSSKSQTVQGYPEYDTEFVLIAK